MCNKRHMLRLSVRLGCFLLAVSLLLPLPFWTGTSRVFVQASSFVAICTILAGRALPVYSIPGLAFAAISLVRKRWFCRYACPVGLLLDSVSGMKLPVKVWWKGFPPINHYIVLLTAAGAILRYPLFLWMDPLAFWNSAFSVCFSRAVLAVVLSLSGIVTLLLIAWTSGDLWCARLCPLGATQDFLSRIGSFCRNFRKPKRTETPVTVVSGNSFAATRRKFIAIAAGLGFGLWAQKTGRTQPGTAPLRPPGATDERSFTGLCLRCGNCIRVCPSRIMHPDTGQSGVFGFMSPVVRYETGYCNEECNACTQVCPSGAIRPLNPEQKRAYVIGEARLDRALCLFGISDCSACVNACPFDAIEIFWNKESYESYPAIDPLKCNGCGACEAYCPTGDIRAIKVWKKGE